MTLGQTIFILAIMPFTIVGMLVVSSKIATWFDKHKRGDKDE